MAISKASRSVCASGALVHLDVEDVAPGLLVVEGEVLDVADDLVALQALHPLRSHLAGENGILTQVLEGAPVARLAHEVHAAAERGVVLLVAQLAPDDVAIGEGQLQIPSGGFGDRRRQERGVAAAFRRAPDADRRVGVLQERDPESLDALGHACAAVRAGARLGEAAGAAYQAELLVERHLLENHVGPRVGIERCVHPRALGRLRRSLRSDGSHDRQHERAEEAG